MRFDDRVTGKLALYAPHAKKIHIDIDPSELHKNVRADVAIAGDLKTVLQAWLPNSRARVTTAGSRASRRWPAGQRCATSRSCPTTGASVPRTSSTTSGRLPPRAPSSSPTSASTRCGPRSITRREEPGTFITSGGLGTMGFGVPAAIGVKLARPDREVWAIVGDGGFQMTQAELQTIVQENIKVNIAIINNGYLGMVRQWQEFFHHRRYSATPMSSPDYVKLADAHGLPGIRVTRRADMADALRHARRRPAQW